MTQAFSLTAAGTKPAEGMYALMPNQPHAHNCEFYSGTSTDTVTAGSFVKLYGSSTSTVRPVVQAAAVTDVPYGMVVYDAVKNVHGVGDLVALAQSGDSVFMVAGGAISVGAKLQFNATTVTGVDLSGKMANSWTVWGNYDWVANSKEVGKEAGRQILPAIWNPIEKTINTATSDKDWKKTLAKDFPIKIGKNLINLFINLSNNNIEEAMTSAVGTTSLKEKKKIEENNRTRNGKKKIFNMKNKLY